MAERQVITDMGLALTQRLFETVTLWNRLEGRPRAEQFDRALQVEIRDPLWMLTRQWQTGEFRGDDAGSPIFAKLHMATTRLTRFRPDDQTVRRFSDEMPLEAAVEQRPLPFEIGDQAVSMDLRLLMGRQWLKMLEKEVGDFAAEYATRYKIKVPDPDLETDAQIVAHRESWQQIAAVAERMMDGYRFYRHVKDGNNPSEGVSIPPAREADVAQLADRFTAWFEDLFLQPTEDEHAWRPEYLEYQFACSAPEGDFERVYVAEEYYHGRLDWYNVDLDRSGDRLGEPGETDTTDPQATTTRSFVPVQVTYEGMPNTRWWAFEDRKTNFGDIHPNTTDLGKLLFMEFGLIYANDWFLIPHDLPAGSIARVKGMAVTNVFGERTWIEPSRSELDDNGRRWAMFGTSIKGDEQGAADANLLLLPTVPKILESEPLEELMMIRDEIANMVWGVETRIALPSGQSKSGREAALESFAFYRRLLDQDFESGALTPLEIEYQAPVRYQVVNTVPENWIPFIPVHKDGDNREIQLQRASMPRIIEGDPEKPDKIEPRSILLREGLDLDEPYYVHEEEVPRAGARVYQSYQRTRWYGGRVVTWLGIRKQTGRGVGWSGLAFDSLVPVPHTD